LFDTLLAAEPVGWIFGTLDDCTETVAAHVDPQAYPDGQQPPPALAPHRYHPAAHPAPTTAFGTTTVCTAWLVVLVTVFTTTGFVAIVAPPTITITTPLLVRVLLLARAGQDAELQSLPT